MIFLAVFASCEEDLILPDKDKFIYPIPQVDLTEDARVGAFYYSYSSSDWSKPLPFEPELGHYDPLDPEVISRQSQWADDGGIDFLVFKWNGTSGNALLDAFASNVGSAEVKMVIDYNIAHLGASNSSPLEGAKLNTMIAEFNSLADAYIDSDLYYKINDKPVIMISPLNLSSSTQSSVDYSLVINALKEAMSSRGLDIFVIGEYTTGWIAPTNYPQGNTEAMDAVVLTNWSTRDFDRWWGFDSYTDLSWNNWKVTLSSWNTVEFIPCIFPAYNNPGTAADYVFERTAEEYVTNCNVAKRNMGDSRIVMINSWNDFQKGTTLEPSPEYGTEYLEITREQFKVN